MNRSVITKKKKKMLEERLDWYDKARAQILYRKIFFPETMREKAIKLVKMLSKENL